MINKENREIKIKEKLQRIYLESDEKKKIGKQIIFD